MNGLANTREERHSLSRMFLKILLSETFLWLTRWRMPIATRGDIEPNVDHTKVGTFTGKDQIPLFISIIGIQNTHAIGRVRAK